MNSVAWWPPGPGDRGREVGHRTVESRRARSLAEVLVLFPVARRSAAAVLRRSMNARRHRNEAGGRGADLANTEAVKAFALIDADGVKFFDRGQNRTGR